MHWNRKFHLTIKCHWHWQAPTWVVFCLLTSVIRRISFHFIFHFPRIIHWFLTLTFPVNLLDRILQLIFYTLSYYIVVEFRFVWILPLLSLLLYNYFSPIVCFTRSYWLFYIILILLYNNCTDLPLVFFATIIRSLWFASSDQCFGHFKLMPACEFAIVSLSLLGKCTDRYLLCALFLHS